MRLALLLIPALLLTGCEQLSGASDQKIYDAEAIGYACRISLKKPEDCMKENETQSPSSVLDGWKAADKDIREKVLDASMGAHPEMASKEDESAGAAEAPVVPALPATPAVAPVAPIVKDEPAGPEAPKTEEAVKK